VPLTCAIPALPMPSEPRIQRRENKGNNQHCRCGLAEHSISHRFLPESLPAAPTGGSWISARFVALTAPRRTRRPHCRSLPSRTRPPARDRGPSPMPRTTSCHRDFSSPVDVHQDHQVSRTRLPPGTPEVASSSLVGPHFFLTNSNFQSTRSGRDRPIRRLTLPPSSGRAGARIPPVPEQVQPFQPCTTRKCAVALASLVSTIPACVALSSLRRCCWRRPVEDRRCPRVRPHLRRRRGR